MALFPTKKITALTPITPPLTGFEEFECVQMGNSRKATSRDFVLPTDSIITVASMGGFLPGSRQLTAGIGLTFVDSGPGGTFELNATGAVAGPANPTAQVGLVAVNGAAVTYMRSDAAPALSQAIAPTWTDTHIFSAVGDSGLQAAIRLSSGLPQININETDGAVDNRLWVNYAQGENLFFATRSDNALSGNSWLTVQRTGVVVDSINLQGALVQVNGVDVRDATNLFNSGTVPAARLPSSFSGLANPTASVGLAAVNGAATTAMRSDAAPALSQAIAPTWSAQHIFSLSGATNAAIFESSVQPQHDWNETDGAANNRRWRLEVQGEQFLGRVVNDANSAAVTWLTVDRTLNVVDRVEFTSTQLFWNGTPLSIATGANPANNIGLAVINGVAGTFMRSDAAPALSQTINPTWTAQHNYSAAISGLVYPIMMTSNSPGLAWNEADGAANNRLWDMVAGGEQFLGRVRTDDGVTTVNWIVVDRTATTVDQVNFPASGDNAHTIGTAGTVLTGYLMGIAAGGTRGALAAKGDNTAATAAIATWNPSTIGNNVFNVFGTEAAFTLRGSITYDRGGGLTVYNTTSDVRLKTNIKDAPEPADLIDRIQIRSFDWRETGNHLDYWVVAQELYEVFPVAVTRGEKDQHWGVDPSKLVPLMVKELQSIRSRLRAANL